MGDASNIDYRGVVGRYALYSEIAAGGMATVHYGRQLGEVGGFARTVAIKRLLPHLAQDPDFRRMFLNEAKLAARVRHPNVVPTLDVSELEGELLLVMEYVPGESLSRLIRVAGRLNRRMPPNVAVAIMCGALEGLHAAHDATSEKGAPLGLVHRDVSPQNIMVGLDGVPRVLDFGVAKATSRGSETKTDHIKGKIAYMAPEQLAHGDIDRRTDIFAASVVLWQALTGEKLFQGDDVASTVYAVVSDPIRPPSVIARDVTPGLDAVVLRGLDREIDRRWRTARDMAVALEKACPPASAREVGKWVGQIAGDAIGYRAEIVAEIEAQAALSTASIPPEIPTPIAHPAPKFPTAPPPSNPKHVETDFERAPTLLASHEVPTPARMPTSERAPEPDTTAPSQVTPLTMTGGAEPARSPSVPLLLVAVLLTACALAAIGGAAYVVRARTLASGLSPSASASTSSSAPLPNDDNQAIIIGGPRAKPSASSSRIHPR